MNVLPLIGRELRSQARQPFTYWLRVLGAASLLVIATAQAVDGSYSSQSGLQLFRYLYAAFFMAIWVLVPSMTADCVSRERREGTLGLLFLTPLSAYEIVMAKALAHALRAITVGLAVLPVMTIPFLIGGVSSLDVVWAGISSFSAFCLALTAGLLASACSRSWPRALVAAGVFAGIFFLGLCALAATIASAWLAVPLDLEWGWVVLLDAGGMRNAALASMGPAQQWSAVSHLLLLPCYAVLAFLLAMVAATAAVRLGWRDDGPSTAQVWARRWLCTPVLFRSWLRGWLQTRLSRNPIGWLQQRSWSGRSIAFGWLAVMVCYLSAAVTQANVLMYDFLNWQVPIGALLVLSMAGAAAGSFRQERESGALELILVTPLSAAQVLGGRILGLWMQFMPAAVLFLGSWLYLAHVLTFLPNSKTDWKTQVDLAVSFAITFAVLPAIGLFFSLKSRHFLSAWFGTVLMATVVPWLFGFLVGYNWNGSGWMFQSNLDGPSWLLGHTGHLTQVAIAVWLGRLLVRNLEQRSFLLHE